MGSQQKVSVKHDKYDAPPSYASITSAAEKRSVMLCMDQRAIPRTGDFSARTPEAQQLLRMLLQSFPAYGNNASIPPDFNCRNCKAIFSSA